MQIPTWGRYTSPIVGVLQNPLFLELDALPQISAQIFCTGVRYQYNNVFPLKVFIEQL